MSLLTSEVFHLRVIGALLVFDGLAHVILPRALRWKSDLAPLALISRQVIYVHTFFIGLICAEFGLLAIVASPQLVVPSTLSRTILVGAVIFWGARLFVQLFVFDRSLWNQRLLTTLGHIAFAALWIYITGIFVWALLVVV